MATPPKVPQQNTPRKRQRSPAYPFINLETAIKRAKEFYAQEGRNAAPLKVAVRHWGYEEKSSGGLQTAAALMSFGLMQDEGTGDKRKLKLTPAALAILLDERPDSESRAQAIKTAALTPKVHQQIWRRWGNSQTSDANIKHMLILELNPPFNPNTAEVVIKEYRDTIAFSKPDSSATVPLAAGDSEAESEVKDNEEDTFEGGYRAKIGDYVQWEHNGVLGLPEPKRLKRFAPGGEYAYVEDQHGAVPVKELIREPAPLTAQTQPDPNLVQRFSSSPKVLMQEFVVPLSDGNKAVFQYPSVLTKEDVEDLKDSLKMLERKISRPVVQAKTSET
ncbi:MAG: hypothetical protein ACLPLR_15355 [Terriglobales bacterium]